MASRTPWAALLIFLARAPAEAQPNFVLQLARDFQPPHAVPPLGVAAGPDGYVWIASGQGLVRFDGRHFHTILPGRFNAVAETSDGVVWAASSAGLTSLAAGKAELRLKGQVRSIVAQGARVVVSEAPAGRLSAGGIAGFQSIPATANGPLSLGGDGQVWFGCGSQICALATDNTITRTHTDRPVDSAAMARNGELWIANPHPRRLGATPVVEPRRVPTTGFRPGWDDGLTVGQSRANGLFLDPLPGGPEPAILLDHAERSWLATNEELLLLSRHAWIRSMLSGDLRMETWSIAPAGDSLHLSTGGGVVEIDRTGHAHWLPGRFISDEALSTVEAANGDRWVLFRRRGLLRLNRHGEVTADAYEGSMVGLELRQLYRGASGELWVTSKYEGLLRLDERSLTLEPAPLPGNSRYSSFLTRSADGVDWVAYAGGAASRQGGKWVEVLPGSMLATPRIRSIAVAPGPVFWITYRLPLPPSRVWREGGTWKRRDFPTLGTDASGVLLDRRGWIWMGTESGLLVSDGKHFEPENWVRLTRDHNLPANPVQLYGLYEHTDGAIWVATPSGAARIQPDDSWFRPELLPQRVTRIGWDGGEDLWPVSGRRLSSTRELAFDFAALPEPTLPSSVPEYRLLPDDPQWRPAPAGTVRLRDPGWGRHRLQARPAPEGPVMEFAFTVTPAFGSWVWVLAAGGGGATAGAGWYLRRHAARRRRDAYWKAKNAFVAAAPPPAADLHHLTGQVIAERYEILEPIGKGGFSTVFRARDLETSGMVAIKCMRIHGELAEWQQRRFEKEKEALRRVDHPGVIRLLDAGWISGSEPYLVMNFVSGPSLREVLRSGPLGPQRTAAWLLEIADALDAVHREGIIHHDLKPENILIQEQRLVLVDFGAASIHQATLSGASSIVLASFHYMAPERVQGRSSTASDLYSLAAVAVEMLTGIRYSSLADGSEAGLRAALVGISYEAVRILARGLAYDPEQRPQQVMPFARELAAALARTSQSA